MNFIDSLCQTFNTEAKIEAFLDVYKNIKMVAFFCLLVAPMLFIGICVGFSKDELSVFPVIMFIFAWLSCLTLSIFLPSEEHMKNLIYENLRRNNE